MEHLLEGVEDFGTHAETFAERGSTYGTDHEFLERDGSVGVRTTVDDVHHGHGEGEGVRATDITVEGHVEGSGTGLSHGEGNAEDGVGTEVGLGLRAVEREHLVVDAALIEYAVTQENGRDLLVDVGNGLERTLTAVTLLVAVAEFEGFVLTGRGTGGNRCTTHHAVFERYVYFYCGIAAGIENLASYDFLNFHRV